MITETAKTYRLDQPPTQPLRGGRLLAARTAWIVLAASGVLLFLTNITLLYRVTMLPCAERPNQSDNIDYCYGIDEALDALNLSLQAYGTFFTIGILLEIVPWIFLGILIFWRRSDQLYELVFGLAMILIATVNLDQGLLSWGYYYYPQFGTLFRVLQLIASILFVFVIYLFPDGRFTSSVFRILAIIWVVVNFFDLFFPYSPFNPFEWLPELNLFLYLYLLSGVAALVYRYKFHSSPIQRQQIKLFVLGLPVVVIGFMLASQIPFDATTPTGILVQFAASGILYLSSVITALTLAVSMLRYRLWNLDFVINRTLVYGALTILLGLVFVGAFFPLRALWIRILGEGQEVVAAVLPAVFVTLIFTPTQHRVRRFVDSRLYGIKVDYIAAAKADDSSPHVYRANPTRDTFGIYTGLSLLGRGGMGEVYQAQHPTLNRLVAIKILPPHAQSQQHALQRFVREAKTIAQLKHPNIVTLHEFGDQDGQPYMVMEHIDGPDLSDLLKQRGRLPLDQALPILQDIASALDYAHSQGIVHRDIKPSNVMVERVTSSGQEKTFRAVLMDFGIAKTYAAGTQLTQSGMIGTLDYISPEQIQGSSEVDTRADIYSFGVMTYQLLTGEVPFKHNNPGAMVMAHLMQPAPDPRQVVRDLPHEAAETVMRAMSKKPEQRFSTAGEFILMLAKS